MSFYASVLLPSYITNPTHCSLAVTILPHTTMLFHLFLHPSCYSSIQYNHQIQRLCRCNCAGPITVPTSYITFNNSLNVAEIKKITKRFILVSRTTIKSLIICSKIILFAPKSMHNYLSSYFHYHNVHGQLWWKMFFILQGQGIIAPKMVFYQLHVLLI